MQLSSDGLSCMYWACNRSDNTLEMINFLNDLQWRSQSGTITSDTVRAAAIHGYFGVLEHFDELGMDVMDPICAR